MKLSLYRVTLLLQFLATLVADDDDVTSPHSIDITQPSAITDESNEIEHPSENDGSIDAFEQVRTQPQHVEMENTIHDNVDAKDQNNIETAAENVHDDSLSSLPSMIPDEIMDIGNIQTDHIDIAASSFAEDDHIEYTNTRTKTDTTSEEMGNISVHMGEQLDREKNEVNNRSPDAKLEETTDVIPENGDTKAEPTKTDEKRDIEIETDTRLDTTEEKDDEDDEDKRPSNKFVVDYADKSTGAIILDKSPEFKGTNNLLVGNNDRYAISPCEGVGVKYVIIGLSEDIEVHTIKLSSYERYSSQIKKFEVLGSTTYPISTKWEKLGTFEAKPWFKENGEQAFELEHPSWCRYLKFRFLTHYGVEHYCTLTEVKVHGSTTQQGFQMEWDAREVEESGGQHEETIVKNVQVDGSSHDRASNEGHKEEHKDGTGVPESTLSNENVKDDVKHDNDLDDVNIRNDEHDTKVTDHINKLGEEDDQVDALNDTSSDAIRKEVNGNKEMMVEGTKSTSTTHHKPDNQGKSENMIPNESEDIQTIETEDHEEIDSSAVSNISHKSKTIPLSGKAVPHVSNTPSNELIDERLRNLQKPIAPHSLNYVFSNLSHFDPEFSALASASIKTASSKFSTEAAKVESNNVWVVDSQISVNQMKTKISGERTSMEGKNGASPANTQGMSSKVSKVVKDAIDSMNIMNMEGAPSIAGLLEIINSKLTPEASHDSEESKNLHDEIGSEVTLTEDALVEPEVVFTDAYGSSSNEDAHLLPPDTVVETKSEPSPSRHDLLKSISDQACLEDLDFQVFKSKYSKVGGIGTAHGNGAAGGSKNEPIFKKLTDEIRVLQASQSIHDQYVKAMTICYERVIFDFYKEMSLMKVEQEERLLSMEEQLQNLVQKEEKSSYWEIIWPMMLSYWNNFIERMKPYLIFANQLYNVLLHTMNDCFQLVKSYIYENETLQELFQLIILHMGEIYAFFAGTVFCFFVVSFVWWSQNRTDRKINNVGNDGLRKTELDETLDMKKQEEMENEKENGNEKRKRKKNRRIRKPSLQQLTNTDFSESSLGSIHNNSFG